MKKFLALILSLLMVLSVFTVSAFAAECDHNSLEGGTVVKEPTCNSTGIRSVYCDTCGQYIYFNIEPINHSWKWTVTKAPTLNTTGLKDGVCLSCGKSQTNVVVPKLECSVHSADLTWEEKADWEIVFDSTCLETGKKQAWCTGCNKYIIKEIPKKDHYLTVYPQIDANCEDYGVTESVYCLSCRDYVVEPKIIPATGHVFFVLVDELDPTCTEVGKGHTYCANEGCDYVAETEIPKIDHDDADRDEFCDMCSTRICRCICHMDHFIARFIRKLNTLLNKLLNGGEMVFCCCECMEPLEF